MTLCPERYTIRIYIKEPAMNARLPTSALPPIAQKDSTVFISGNSQAVRIPKEFQFETKQVTITQRGDELVIKPKYKTWAEILAHIPPLTAKEATELDFVMLSAKRSPLATEKRDWSWLQDEDTHSTVVPSSPSKKTSATSRSKSTRGR
jgi:antitoxin VapB